MDPLTRDASNILETALLNTGEEWTLLVGTESGVRLISASDWSLESLRVHHGAERAYRIHRRFGRTEVEASNGQMRCLLQSEPPAQTARKLLSARI